jgi:hypothetical protein
MSKSVYRVVKKPDSHGWIYHVEKRTRAEVKFLFFTFKEEWLLVDLENTPEDAMNHIKNLKEADKLEESVIYRSDLDDTTEEALLDN